MSGWIKIYRKIQKHWLWENPMYLKAWICILLTVNHESQKVLINGNLMECGRGQSLLSLQSWVKIFGKNWTIQRVRHFFELLSYDSMIVCEGLQKTTRITVCNYDIYQDQQQTNNTQTTFEQHTNNTQTTTNKNDKEYKNEKNDKNNSLKDEIIGFKQIEDCKKKADRVFLELFPILFENFRKRFPGVKKGFEVEKTNFIKKNKPEIVIDLMIGLSKEIEYRDKCLKNNKWVSEWKNLSTWINQKCWEQEFPEIKTEAVSVKKSHAMVNHQSIENDDRF